MNKHKPYLWPVPNTDHQKVLGFCPDRYQEDRTERVTVVRSLNFNSGELVRLEVISSKLQLIKQVTKRRDPSQRISHLVPARCASGKAVFRFSA